MVSFLRQLGVAVRALLVCTVVLGVAYPALVLGIAALGFGDQRTGSMISRDGTVVASGRLGQAVEGEGWFVGRPSAGDHDAQASGGSNAGPNDPDLTAEIEARRAAVAEREQVAPDRVPADAVTASASGLDPDISPEYAELQAPRVARERGIDVERVRRLVAEHTEGRQLGFLGQPRVDVVGLNLAVERAQATG